MFHHIEGAADDAIRPRTAGACAATGTGRALPVRCITRNSRSMAWAEGNSLRHRARLAAHHVAGLPGCTSRKVGLDCPPLNCSIVQRPLQSAGRCAFSQVVQQWPAGRRRWRSADGLGAGVGLVLHGAAAPWGCLAFCLSGSALPVRQRQQLVARNDAPTARVGSTRSAPSRSKLLELLVDPLARGAEQLGQVFLGELQA